MSRISARTLRGDADNLAHGNRDIYPVGQLLDAAETIDTLHNDLAAANTRLTRLSAVIEAMDEALKAIASERMRQIEVESWDAAHDDTHDTGQLAEAAACYAIGQTLTQHRVAGTGRPGHPKRTITTMLWPWDLKWWKPRSRRYDLVRAGALIVAEIERIDRAARATKAAMEWK